MSLRVLLPEIYWPSVNATPFGYVTDRESIDPGRSARVGLLARDGAARFDDFALYLAT